MLFPEFSAADQVRFAELSGDYNPLHLDEVLARRFMFGGAVVHGVHIMLRALDAVREDRPGGSAIGKIKAQFRAPVSVSMPLTIEIRDPELERTQITVKAGTAVACQVSVDWAEDNRNVSAFDLPSGRPEREACAVIAPEDRERVTGEVPLSLDRERGHELLPAVTSRLPRVQVAVLLATTRIVGMRCPGYHSVFSELNVEFGEVTDAEPILRYSVSRFDPRFSLFTIEIAGCGVSGRLSAFERPRPQEQPSTRELREAVAPGEFAGRRALVAGGSRGMGEFSAKLLALGGAEVVITYRTGEADARAVVEDIAGNGGKARCIRHDVTSSPALLLDALGTWRPSHLLYFATPGIFRPRYETFSKKYFDEFAAIYVSAFAGLFQALVDDGGLSHVLYPSTVAVAEPPKELLEYAAAKSAAETLLYFLRRQNPDITFDVPRLPRLPTDQTANIYGVAAEDPLPLLMDLLR